MSRRDATSEAVEAERTDGEEREADDGGTSVGAALGSVREKVTGGALAGVGGGVLALRGIRRFRAGARIRGIAQTATGAALVAVAVARRRRSSDEPSVDRTDVVDTGPDLEDAVSEFERDATGHASGDEAATVAESSVDIEDAVEESESERETDEASDRLGSAAYDGESDSLPAPQEAFNRKFLALGAEAAWGIRESDDAVVVSQLYDSIEDREELRYVASSEVDDERMITVPDAIHDHWELAEDAVVDSGDGIAFATSDDLEADGLLLVVPAAWADDVLGEPE